MFSKAKPLTWEVIGDRTKGLILDYLKLYDERPERSAELAELHSAISTAGFLEALDEWRISTWFKTRFEKQNVDGREVIAVSVSCDGQTLSCECPNVERAHFFAKWYQHQIVYQFYSCGPTWR